MKNSELSYYNTDHLKLYPIWTLVEKLQLEITSPVMILFNDIPILVKPDSNRDDIAVIWELQNRIKLLEDQQV